MEKIQAAGMTVKQWAGIIAKDPNQVEWFCRWLRDEADRGRAADLIMGWLDTPHSGFAEQREYFRHDPWRGKHPCGGIKKHYPRQCFWHASEPCDRCFYVPKSVMKLLTGHKKHFTHYSFYKTHPSAWEDCLNAWLKVAEEEDGLWTSERSCSH